MEIRSFATTAVDKLGRRLPLSAQPPGGRKPRLTALFYFLWNGEHGDAAQLIPKNVSAILREEPRAGYMPDAPLWGGPSAFYYWGEPLYGYYLSRDPWVMSRHVELFVEAGIDVLIFDATNAFIYTEVVLRLLEVLDEGRRMGWPVPRIAYYTNSSPGTRRSGYTGTFMRRGSIRNSGSVSEANRCLSPARRRVAGRYGSFSKYGSPSGPMNRRKKTGSPG